MKTLKQFAFVTFAALAVALTISSCSQNTNAGKSDEGQENTIKATYVLVHGGWCASWCWDFAYFGEDHPGISVITTH